jgi:hypothetical protein
VRPARFPSTCPLSFQAESRYHIQNYDVIHPVLQFLGDKIPQKTCRRILEKAKQRGYCPAEDPRILEHHVKDGVRSGRPRDINKEVEKRLLNLIIEDRNGREKSSEVLAYKTGISTSKWTKVWTENAKNREN